MAMQFVSVVETTVVETMVVETKGIQYVSEKLMAWCASTIKK